MLSFTAVKYSLSCPAMVGPAESGQLLCLKDAASVWISAAVVYGAFAAWHAVLYCQVLAGQGVGIMAAACSNDLPCKRQCTRVTMKSCIHLRCMPQACCNADICHCKVWACRLLQEEDSSSSGSSSSSSKRRGLDEKVGKKRRSQVIESEGRSKAEDHLRCMPQAR